MYYRILSADENVRADEKLVKTDTVTGTALVSRDTLPASDDGLQNKIVFDADGTLYRYDICGKPQIIGKTQNEIADISLDESGRPADADLASGCTIKVGAIKEAFVKACESASDMGAKQGDELKIAITTVASASSKSASEDGNGSVEIDSEFCALTLDKSGIISSILVDSSQGEVEFDLGGIIVTDVTKPYPTKKEEGDEYGMKDASAIGKEWYEQAKAIEQYAKGLTVQKLSDTPFENQKPAPDSDLASGCTMRAEGIILNAVKAANS